MFYALLVIAAAICAFRAIRARHLLSAAIWLAGVSALVATIMYRLGAQQVAVVELSVGAGLVTVVFVFAISIAGDDGLSEAELLPGALTLVIAALVVLVLGGLLLPADAFASRVSEVSFRVSFWEDRALDVVLQLVLIFTGVLCLLGLLTAYEVPDEPVTADAVPRARISSKLPPVTVIHGPAPAPREEQTP